MSNFNDFLVRTNPCHWGVVDRSINSRHAHSDRPQPGESCALVMGSHTLTNEATIRRYKGDPYTDSCKSHWKWVLHDQSNQRSVREAEPQIIPRYTGMNAWLPEWTADTVCIALMNIRESARRHRTNMARIEMSRPCGSCGSIVKERSEASSVYAQNLSLRVTMHKQCWAHRRRIKPEDSKAPSYASAVNR